MNEAEGNFEHQPEPEKPTNMEEFERQSNRELKPFGRKIVRESYYDLMKYGLFILLGFVLIMGYAVLNDKFSDTMTCPSITIPEPVACPSCTCPNISNHCAPTLNCAPIPSNLTITLANNSG